MAEYLANVELFLVDTVNYTKPTDSDTMRAMVMTFEALLEEEYNQVRGFTYIFDFKGVGLTTVSIWSPSEFQKAFSISEVSVFIKKSFIHL